MRSKPRGLSQRKLALPDGPRWSKPRVDSGALRAVLLYGAMSAGAVAISLALRDGPAWEHPAPWLALRKPAAVGMSAALGLFLAAAAIASTRIVTVRFAWGRRLHRDLRPMARHLGLGHILLLAGLSSLGEELLFRGLLTPAIGASPAPCCSAWRTRIAGPSRRVRGSAGRPWWARASARCSPPPQARSSARCSRTR
ncbi:MAG: CPBP family intramembrane glutamate endopeptidase [Polyangiaceae bacterium]